MRRVASLVIALALGASGCRDTRKPPPASPTAKGHAVPVDALPAAIDATPDRATQAAAALIGTKPPAWQVERWLNSAPRTLESLRGSVVLVRWWTAGCPFCSTSAPALRAFHRELGPRGLAVIGLYHHKEEGPFDPRVYEETARKYGFTFPLGFDPDWKTLKSWLRDAHGQPVDTGWTSITFVLDQHGVVRYVHPGGQYVAGDPAHAELRAVLERLLAAR